jgi:3-deoxy-D-manno-octulosonate 8-phosphate phosphatase (KDO 8-P phosphatase)
MTESNNFLRQNLASLEQDSGLSRGSTKALARFLDKGKLEMQDFLQICFDLKLKPELLLSKDIRITRKKIRLLVMDCDGVLTKGEMIVSTNGEHTKVFNVKDGMGIQLAHKAGILTGIISHGYSSEVVVARAKQLQISKVFVGKSPKMEILKQWWKEENIGPEETAYIGDDLNDLPVLEQVGAAFCPADAVDDLLLHPKVHVLKKKGGEGCLRELVEEHFLL